LLLNINYSFASIELNQSDSILDITSRVKIISSHQIPTFQNFQNEKTNNSKLIKFHYSTKANWIRFSIINKSSHLLKRFIVFDHYLTGKMQLFKKENDEWKQVDIAGSSVLHRDNSKKTFLAPLNITLEGHKKSDFLIKNTGHHKLNSRLFITDTNSLNLLLWDKSIIILLYIGAVFALGIYNLILAFITKETVYYLYCGFIFSMAAAINTIFGGIDYAFSFLSFSMSDYLMVFTSVTVIFALAFARNILEIEVYFKKLNHAFRFLQFLAIVHILTSIFKIRCLGEIHFGTTVDILIALAVLLMLLSAIASSYKGSIMARFYLSSWFFLFSGACLWFGMSYGLLPKNFLTTYALFFGNVFEMLFIAIGLAYKISTLDQKAKQSLFETKEKEEYRRLMRSLCHDIANSLFVITGYTKRYAKNPERVDSKASWQKISKAAKQMEMVLNSVRAQDLINKDKKSISLSSICVSEVIKESRFIFEEKLNAKNVFIQNKLGSDCVKDNCDVMADKTTLLHNVINNILSNAIKFSNTNSVISITKNIDKTYKRIIIRDFGIGISDEKLAKIRNREDVLSTIGTKGETGTGYGMSLMYSYMELYGGKVEINSWTDKTEAESTGTEVTLCFPI
jgi:signal transduction histidine kinase